MSRRKEAVQERLMALIQQPQFLQVESTQPADVAYAWIVQKVPEFLGSFEVPL